MKERHRQRVEAYDSVILAATHAFLEAVIFLTMGVVYRLLGIPRERITLRHAETYLVTTTVLLISLVLLAQFFGFLGWPLIVLGNLRVLQIICLNLNTLLFDIAPVSDSMTAVRRARWHFVAIGFSFLDTVLIFGFMYQFFDTRFRLLSERLPGFLDYLYHALITIATIGYGDIHPVTTAGRILTMYEAGVALLFLVFFVSGALARLHRS